MVLAGQLDSTERLKPRRRSSSECYYYCDFSFLFPRWVFVLDDEKQKLWPSLAISDDACNSPSSSAVSSAVWTLLNGCWWQWAGALHTRRPSMGDSYTTSFISVFFSLFSPGFWLRRIISRRAPRVLSRAVELYTSGALWWMTWRSKLLLCRFHGKPRRFLIPFIFVISFSRRRRLSFVYY